MPFTRSIAMPTTSLIFSQAVFVKLTIVGHKMFQMPSTIGANVLNNETTRSSPNLTESLIASIVHSNVVDISLSIFAPSESYQDLTPSKCLLKNYLYVYNYIFHAFLST